MQDANKLIILYFFLFSCFVSMSQEITGIYQLVDQSLVVADAGVTYNFKSNGTFEKSTHEHLEKKYIFGGEYSLRGDTLILKYENIGANPLSEAKLNTKEKLNTSEILNSEIRVFNSKGDPLPGVNLLMQNKEKALVMGFSSDKEGKFPSISIHDNYIQYFTLSFLALKEISINTDSLFGYKTNIEIYLRDSTVTYGNTVKSVKFLILDRTRKSLELQPLNGASNSCLELRKINKN